MSTSTVHRPSTSDRTHTQDQHKLIVHFAGEKAGLMQVEVELPPQIREDAADSEDVRLEIPGETTPLKPLDVTDADGHHVVSFFSADIANAGHLPASATLTFTMPDGSSVEKQLRCISAEAADDQATSDAVASVETYPADRYPRTVGIMALIGLAVGLTVMSLWLLAL